MPSNIVTSTISLPPSANVPYIRQFNGAIGDNSAQFHRLDKFGSKALVTVFMESTDATAPDNLTHDFEVLLLLHRDENEWLSIGTITVTNTLPTAIANVTGEEVIVSGTSLAIDAPFTEILVRAATTTPTDYQYKVCYTLV